MAIYRSGDAGRDAIRIRPMLRMLGAALGLRHVEDHRSAEADGIVAIEIASEGGRAGYIPYTNRTISWHTDGYYNFHGASNCVQAMLLHCVRPAMQGGANSLLDHEIVYLLLRDENPEYIKALMRPDAMTIPANTESGSETRGAQSGPVFAVDELTGALHMRYTARTRSIEWRQDRATREAVAFLEALLSGDSPYVFRHRLSAGQGLLCNNVLHNRSAFEDGAAADQKRLIYRARYYDRIAGTEPGANSD